MPKSDGTQTVEELILTAVDDLVYKLLRSDRKTDEKLPLNAIEQALDDDHVTVDDIIKRFSRKLRAMVEWEDKPEKPRKDFWFTADCELKATDINDAFAQVLKHFQTIIDGGNPKVFSQGTLRIRPVGNEER